MTNNVIQTSFSGGEMSTTLLGRVDLARYHVSARKMYNYFVDYRGGATSRAGTQFISTVFKPASATRLVEFQFNTDQTYILEFGDLYFRVFKDGTAVLEATKAITGATRANPCVITSVAHGYTTGDWVYISGVAGMTQLNGMTYKVSVIGANSYSLVDIYTNAAVNSTAYTAYTSGGTGGKVYTPASPYAAVYLDDLKWSQSNDVMTFTHPLYNARMLTRTAHNNWIFALDTFGASINSPTGLTVTASAAGTTYFGYVVTAVSGVTGDESLPCPAVVTQGVNNSTTAGSYTISWNLVTNAEYYNVYKTYITPAVDIPDGSSFGYVGTSYGLSFVDGNITADFTKTPPIHKDPFNPAQILRVVPVAPGAGYATHTTTCTIADATGTDAVVYPIVVGGAVVAYNPIIGGINFTAPTVTVVGAGAGATNSVTLSPSTGCFPTVSCYFQQRKVFAGTVNYPQTLWATRPGQFTSMDVSNPSAPNDALTLTIAATQVNAIKSLVPMPGGLLTFTSTGVWQVSGGGQLEPITPTSAQATPQAYTGSCDLRPLVINYEILFVQADQATVRNLSYNFYANIYTGADVSIFSNHLFTGYQLKEWTWCAEPFKTVWAVRSDGALLSLTFIKEQELSGWAEHGTYGTVSSITSVKENNRDVPYMIVNRPLRGAYVPCIERMQDRHLVWGTVEDAWTLDCALALPQPAPATYLTVSASTGSVTIIASAASWDVTAVGRVIRTGGGKITVTGYTSSTLLSGTVTQEITAVLPGTTTPKVQPPGAWTITTPVTTVSGLGHLATEVVQVVADGVYIGTKTVSTAGTITLTTAASDIKIGFGFRSKLQTLPLDLGDPTVQGKRKKLSALNIIANETHGLYAGPDFDNMFPVKDWNTAPAAGKQATLYTGQTHIIMNPSYNVEGQLCIEQREPYPSSILAVVPEITVGDSMK